MRHYCNRQQSKKEYGKKQNTVLEGSVPKHSKDERSFTESVECIDSDKRADSAEKSDNDDDVIFPPGADLSGLRAIDVSENVHHAEKCPEFSDFGDAIGGAISQGGGYRKQTMTDAEKLGHYICPYLSQPRRGSLYADNVSGKFNVISVPDNRETPYIMNSMMRIIEKYRGKFVCIDLWNNDSIRIEKCGYLESTGEGLIIVENPSKDEVTMLDLNTIKFVSIYCK